jgi:hypothetical protein
MGLKATESSKQRYEEFLRVRTKHNKAFEEKFGIAALHEYRPHVSLAYFANQEGAQEASKELPAWNETFEKALQGVDLPLNTVGLYGFTDMINYLRK